MKKRAEKLKLFGARLPADLIERIKVEALRRKTSAQRLVRDAIEGELRRTKR